MIYFIVNIYINEKQGIGKYDEYIEAVKPIVEGYGGTYLIRSNNIIGVDEDKIPDRFIVIKFESREQYDQCFKSQEYCEIAFKRSNFVESKAFIVEE